MKINKLKLGVLLFAGSLAFSSCKKDAATVPATVLQSKTYDYTFATGYIGSHANTLTAKMTLEEQTDGQTKITVTLNNTLLGKTYMVHAHDKDTNHVNGYNPTPNSKLFIQSVAGNGGSASASQISSSAINEIITNYSGFLVVHDPLVAVNTADPSTYVILGSFARAQNGNGLRTVSFDYNFATGYIGNYPTNLTAKMTLEEEAGDKTKVIITLNNTQVGKTYMIHAHDKDVNQTNGYNPTPNSAVLLQAVAGNGGAVTIAQTSNKSYTELTSTYEGFLVVHDPLIPTDINKTSTFVILGTFARTQPAASLRSASFNYTLATGYIGLQANTLTSTLKLEEQPAGKTKITVTLNNTAKGKTYMVHVHDKDANQPNGYNTTPNSSIFTLGMLGNGGNVSSTQIANMSYTELTAIYEGFLVVHDPFVVVNVNKPSTFVILGDFARPQPAPSLRTVTFNYTFSGKYVGGHPKNLLTATLKLEEQPAGKTKITVTLDKTLSGKTYVIHAHDKDKSLLGYNTTPNSTIFAQAIVIGNGGVEMAQQISNISYTQLTALYDGYLIVHDPLVAVNPADASTLVVKGSFARFQLQK